MKNCENCNDPNDVLIFVHRHTQLLCAQLKASNWPEHVQQLWESIGVKRVFSALYNHPHPQIAQYVVETKMVQLIKDLTQCPRKGLRNNESEQAMLQLQMVLIPSYFVRLCNKQIENLIKVDNLQRGSHPPLSDNTQDAAC